MRQVETSGRGAVFGVAGGTARGARAGGVDDARAMCQGSGTDAVGLPTGPVSVGGAWRRLARAGRAWTAGLAWALVLPGLVGSGLGWALGLAAPLAQAQAPAPAAAPQPAAAWVAMALDRQGEVQVSSPARKGRLQVLDYLPLEADLTLPAGSRVTLVYLATSQEWQLEGPGRVRLLAAQPRAEQGAAPRLNEASGARPAMAREPAQRERLTLGAMVMRGAHALGVVSPNQVDVLGPRPSLLWHTLQDRPVRVSLFDAATGTRVAQVVTSERQWAPAADLPPGAYTWQVEFAADPTGPPQQAAFRVMADADERRQRLGPAPAADAPFAQRVAYALMLQGQDLRHDALLMWRALSAERPDEESLRQRAR